MSSNVFYISDSYYHVRELYYTNGKWWGNDLTPDANGPAADPASQLTSFFDGSVEHVFYVSPSVNHARELYYTNGKWWGNDLPDLERVLGTDTSLKVFAS